MAAAKRPASKITTAEAKRLYSGATKKVAPRKKSTGTRSASSKKVNWMKVGTAAFLYEKMEIFLKAQLGTTLGTWAGIAIPFIIWKVAGRYFRNVEYLEVTAVVNGGQELAKLVSTKLGFGMYTQRTGGIYTKKVGAAMTPEVQNQLANLQRQRLIQSSIPKSQYIQQSR